MKRTTVFLEERVESDLHAVARRRKRPVSALVREALQRFVSEETRKEGFSLRFLAVGASGRRDTATLHEELLWKDLKPHGVRPASRAGNRKRRRPG